MNLEHKQRTPVSKRMRAEIRLNSDSYKSKHEHNITVTSTYPFRAKETSTSNNRSNNNDVMKWMDVRLLIDSIYGGDTSKVCLLTQLLSSPCFIETGILYTRIQPAKVVLKNLKPPLRNILLRNSPILS